MIKRFCVLKWIRKLIFFKVGGFSWVVINMSQELLINYDQVFLQTVTMNRIIEFIPYADYCQ